MLGSIQLEKFTQAKLSQKAASAWTAAMGSLVGCKYTPLLYLGAQNVKGVNHWFIAEQTTVTANPTRRVVKIAINEFGGKYSIVKPIEIIAA